MSYEQKKRLIRSLEVRMEQLMADEKERQYPLHDGHHVRDILTILAVFNKKDNAEALLKNMPTEDDLPKKPQ